MSREHQRHFSPRKPRYEQLETRQLLAAVVEDVSMNATDDPTGQTTEVAPKALESTKAEVQTSSGQVDVSYRLDVVDRDGRSIHSMKVGEEAYLEVHVQDQRLFPFGVFAGYLDVEFNSERAEPTGEIEYGLAYPNVHRGVLQDGLVDDAGAVAWLRELGGREYLLFRVPFRATSAGALTFSADPADLRPHRETLVYRLNRGVDDHRIRYGTRDIVVAELSQTAGEKATCKPIDDAAAAELSHLATSPMDASPTTRSHELSLIIGPAESTDGTSHPLEATATAAASQSQAPPERTDDELRATDVFFESLDSDGLDTLTAGD